VAFVRRAILTFLFLAPCAAGVAQDLRGAVDRHLAAGKPELALALVDDALRASPDAIDALLLRALCLAHRGDLAATRESVEQATAVHRRRLAAIEAILAEAAVAKSTPATTASAPTSTDQAHGTRSAPAAPASRPEPGSTEELHQLVADADSAEPTTRESAKRGLREASVRQIAAATEREQAGDPGDARRRLDAIVQASVRHPEATLDALAAATTSPDPKVSSTALDCLTECLDAITRSALESFAAGKTAEGTRRMDVVVHHQRRLYEPRHRERAVRTMQAFAKSSIPAVAAKGLRAMGNLLVHWANRLEEVDGNAPGIEQERQQLLALNDELFADPATREAAEDCLRAMRSSRFAAVRTVVAERLAKWGALRAERGRRLQASDPAAAAAELARAHGNDPTREQDAFDAAMLFEQAQQPGQATPLYKQLAATAAAERKDASQRRLDELFAAARPTAAALRKRGIRGDDLPAMRKELNDVVAALPVLEGPEHEAVEQLLAQGLVDVARTRLTELVDAIATGARRARTPSGERPEIGRDFDLAGEQLSFRWVAEQGQGGCWFAMAPVQEADWQALVPHCRTPGRDEHGALEMSWNNATVLCSEINARERNAQRLPPGYRYAIPTRAQLRRIADAQERLPAMAGRYVWTADEHSFVKETDEMCYLAIAIDGGSARPIRQSLPPVGGVGLLLVLAPETVRGQ
jgi:hypothetical protein